MKPFRYLPHTADMRFRAYGGDFRQALQNSALALLGIMLDVRRIRALKATVSRLRLSESADTQEELVWFTLQDMLSKVDSAKLNAYALRISRLEKRNGKFRLSASILYKRTRIDCSMLSVKAVTPSGLAVTSKKGICSIHVIVDV